MSVLWGERNAGVREPLNEEQLVIYVGSFIALSNNIKMLFWIY